MSVSGRLILMEHQRAIQGLVLQNFVLETITVIWFVQKE